MNAASTLASVLLLKKLRILGFVCVLCANTGFAQSNERASSWEEWIEQSASTSFFAAQNKVRDGQLQITARQIQDAIDSNPNYRSPVPIWVRNKDNRLVRSRSRLWNLDTIEVGDLSPQERDQAFVENMKFLIENQKEDELLIFFVGAAHALDFYLSNLKSPIPSDILYFFDHQFQGNQQLDYSSFRSLLSSARQEHRIPALNEYEAIDRIDITRLLPLLDIFGFSRIRDFSSEHPINDVEIMFEEDQVRTPKVIIFGDFHGSQTSRPADLLPSAQVLKASGINRVIFAKEPRMLGAGKYAPNGLDTIITATDSPRSIEIHNTMGYSKTDEVNPGLAGRALSSLTKAGLFEYDTSGISFLDTLNEWRDDGLLVDVIGIESPLHFGTDRGDYKFSALSPNFQRSPIVENMAKVVLEDRPEFSDPVREGDVPRVREPLGLNAPHVDFTYGDGWRLRDYAANGRPDTFSTDVIFQTDYVDGGFDLYTFGSSRFPVGRVATILGAPAVFPASRPPWSGEGRTCPRRAFLAPGPPLARFRGCPGARNAVTHTKPGRTILLRLSISPLTFDMWCRREKSLRVFERADGMQVGPPTRER